MGSDSRIRKRLYVSAIVLGLVVGSVGVATAMTGDPPADTTDQSTDDPDPSYTGSIQAPGDGETLSKADESAQLDGLATITPEEAASATVAGTVDDVEFDNANGLVVYSVEITDGAGTEVDVKVDGGNGTVLDQQSDDDAEEVGSANDSEDEAEDDGVHNETEHEGQDDPGDGHED